MHVFADIIFTFRVNLSDFCRPFTPDVLMTVWIIMPRTCHHHKYVWEIFTRFISDRQLVGVMSKEHWSYIQWPLNNKKKERKKKSWCISQRQFTPAHLALSSSWCPPAGFLDSLIRARRTSESYISVIPSELQVENICPFPWQDIVTSSLSDDGVRYILCMLGSKDIS